MQLHLACNHQHFTGCRLAPCSTAALASLATLLPPSLVQARKQFPQLMEFAQRLECGGELGAETVSTFMHQVLRRRTAASYDNIIARSGMDDEEEVRSAMRACVAMACIQQVVRQLKWSHFSGHDPPEYAVGSSSASCALKARVAALSHRGEAGMGLTVLSVIAAVVLQELGLACLCLSRHGGGGRRQASAVAAVAVTSTCWQVLLRCGVHNNRNCSMRLGPQGSQIKHGARPSCSA